MDDRPRRYQSVFWPIVLIGVGTVWLLVNLNILPAANLTLLWQLWPLLLIGIGFDILFGRHSFILSALVGLILVAAVVALLLYAPQLELTGTGQLQTSHFSQPVDGAASAQVTLELSPGAATVRALEDSNNLIQADLTYLGRVDFTATGGPNRIVVLRRSLPWLALPSGGNDAERFRWDVGLSPQVPMELTLKVASGRAALDLSKLQLTALSVDASSGETSLSLPATAAQGGRLAASVDASSSSVTAAVPAGASLELSLNVSSGSARVTAGDNAQALFRVECSSGSVVIDMPDDAAVHVEVHHSSSGDVRLPERFARISGTSGDEGTWETPGFASAERQVTIIVEDVSSGDVEVR